MLWYENFIKELGPKKDLVLYTHLDDNKMSTIAMSPQTLEIYFVSKDDSYPGIDVDSIEIVPTTYRDGQIILVVGSQFRYQGEMFSVIDIDSWFDQPDNDQETILRVQYTVAPLGQ